MRVNKAITGVTGVLALLVGVGVAGWAAPAAAEPAGLETSIESTAKNSVDKAITAPCPVGKVVTGGGGYLNTSSAEGRVGLDRLEPLANGTGFVATMREVGAVDYAEDWQLSALAMCATPPAGYQVVAVTGAVGTEYVTASCGTKSVIGMGGRINSGLGEVVLDQVVPSFDLRSVTTRGVRVQGSALAGWSVTAFAVCANTPAGLERISIQSDNESAQQHQGIVACPAGKSLYGAGADINAGNGQVLLTGVNITTENTVRAWANEDGDGYGGNWSFNAYGICGS
ncbi:hypothetical protein [Micromonospora echinofusca]|uniref:Secreted protein n=1 Tax=Micromonospora echinofusca TaxID=47858 RepID=A0ABS3VZQ5_MICEH|nr:hypothetical protein [Micromonospora echinofusca]MBO4209951.1 hypothetical protein [Micromonospora echinofusca]